MKEAIKTIASFLVVCVVVLLVIRYVGQRTIVEGSSMEPTLANGDNLIIDKLTYRFRVPERFEVVVFPCGDEEGTYFIKRVIALPGETVQIDASGAIYIDGKKLRESYGREVIKAPGMAAESLQLGADEYFVLGDNRNQSLDSRDSRVGMIKEADIVGRAWLRIYPLDHLGFIAL